MSTICPTLYISANYNAVLDDFIIFADSTSNTIDVTLPAVHYTGKRFEVKDFSGTTATFAIKIVASGGGTIDGAPDVTLLTSFQSILVHSDGTNWYIM